MAQVTVTIADKVYRMACGDGEEQHLEALAADLDRRVRDLNGSFGEIGDLRLHVMAAIMILDELGEAHKRVAALESELETVKTAQHAGDARLDADHARLAEAVAHAAERIQHVAKSLSGPA
jgi:cell division protein ZapA